MAERSSAPPASEVLLNRRAQMFPTLSDAQVARVARVATTVELPEGTLLFDEGDYGIPFFVVLAGAITVVHPNGSAEEPITVHGPHDFTGEMTMLAGRRGLVRARVTKASRLLRVELPQFQNLMQTDSDLSEVLMRAFILRRVGLLQGDMGDAIVIGSRLSAATLRVQAFLTRNGHPHRYIDIDVEPDVPALLDGFKVSVAGFAGSDLPQRKGTRRIRRTPRSPSAWVSTAPSSPRRSTTWVIVVRGSSRKLAAASVRCLGGFGRARARGDRARRPGGLELEDRELSRLSDGDFWAGPSAKGAHSGREIRREARHRA